MTTRNLAHLAARLYGTPLMLLPSAADALGHTFQQLLEKRGGLIDVADGAAELQLGVETPRVHGFAGNARGQRFKDKPYAVTDEGVGLVGVYGPLLHRFNFDMATCTSFANYQAIEQRVKMMLADPDVKGILFEWDSPGGEVAGNDALARMLRSASASGGKPIWSHANEGAYSAAYNLAANTQRVVVPAAGSVGSIGVVMLHVDQSQRDAKLGLVFTYIFAGDRKVDFNSHQPLSDRAKAIAGAEVERLYDMFVDSVADARRIDAKVVRRTEAGILDAVAAKAMGLVDAVAGFEDTLKEFTALVQSGQRIPGGPKAAAPAKGATMSHTDPAARPEAATDAPQGVPEAEVAKREAAAFERGKQAELERQAGVRAALLPGHEKLIEGFVADGKTTPAQAQAAVIAAERATLAAAEAAHKGDAPRAVPTATAPEGGQLQGAALGRAAVAAFNEFTTGKKGA